MLIFFFGTVYHLYVGLTERIIKKIEKVKEVTVNQTQVPKKAWDGVYQAHAPTKYK